MPAPKNESTPVRLNRAQRRNQKKSRNARDREALETKRPRSPRPESRGKRRHSGSSRHRGNR